MLSFDAWGTEATHFLHEWRGEHKGVTIPLHTSAIEGLWNILRRTGVGDALQDPPKVSLQLLRQHDAQERGFLAQVQLPGARLVEACRLRPVL
jgi:hypothetical protein